MPPRHRPSAPFHCPRCSARWPAGWVQCPACDRALYDDTTLAACRTDAAQLVDDWADDPYLRSATLVSYSLRSRVRGFLDDDRHPFVAALLRFLGTWLEKGGEGAYTQLLPHAETEWIEPRAPLLARALRTLREARGEASLRATKPRGESDGS